MNMRIVVLAAAASVLVATSVVLAVLSWDGSKPAATATAADKTAALARSHAPTVGDPAAKVQIVEFLDPACETCRDFYPRVKRMVTDNSGKVRLSVRHVPLHQGSESVVLMLEAAKKQGKYWQALETLLATQPAWAIQHKVIPDFALAQLAPVGLDLDQLKADMNSPEVMRNVAQDAQDARTLKVTQTPEYFVNGKSMTTFGYEQLQQLVGDALTSNYR